jgi:geranylgeranyl diphosphate synthase type II
MDDDDLRRGKPTLHRKFDEATAILAGDALLTFAFETLVSRVRDQVLAATLCGELSVAAGPAGMVGGQMFDLLGETRRPDATLVDQIHRRKTAALIRASVRMGALAGGATSTLLRDLTRYGEHLGLLFQVTDDLLDVTGDARKTGKRVGKDAGRGKQTYPAVHGIEESRALAGRLASRAEKLLARYGKRATLLLAVPRYVIERSG